MKTAKEEASRIAEIINTHSNQIVKSTGADWVGAEVKDALLAMFTAGFNLGRKIANGQQAQREHRGIDGDSGEIREILYPSMEKSEREESVG